MDIVNCYCGKQECYNDNLFNITVLEPTIEDEKKFYEIFESKLITEMNFCKCFDYDIKSVSIERILSKYTKNYEFHSSFKMYVDATLLNINKLTDKKTFYFEPTIKHPKTKFPQVDIENFSHMKIERYLRTSSKYDSVIPVETYFDDNCVLSFYPKTTQKYKELLIIETINKINNMILNKNYKVIVLGHCGEIYYFGFEPNYCNTKPALH